MHQFIEWLSQPWPWYVTGPLIGLLVPLLLILGNVHFGLSSSYRQICSACVPSGIKYFTEYNWQESKWRLFFAVGIGLGGFVGANYLAVDHTSQLTIAAINDMKALGITSFSQFLPSEIYNWEMLLTPTGMIVMVGGGFLTGFGVRYANGCTSGHAIMGLSLLSVGSLIAVMGFFVGGMVVTNLLLPYIINI